MLSRTCCRRALEKHVLLPELGERGAPPDAVREGALNRCELRRRPMPMTFPKKSERDSLKPSRRQSWR
eukprot:14585599-Alexandrium_andersonii.AAC.1